MNKPLLKKGLPKSSEPLTGVVDQNQVNTWKEQNKGGIYAIEVQGHVAYFRNPTRQDINIAASQLTPDAPMDYFENVMRETYLGGSADVVEDDQLYYGALQEVKTKIDGKKAVLVNL